MIRLTPVLLQVCGGTPYVPGPMGQSWVTPIVGRHSVVMIPYLPVFVFLLVVSVVWFRWYVLCDILES